MRVYTTDEFMKSSKSLHVFRCNGGVNDRGDVHTHDFIEIVYVLAGEMGTRSTDADI